MAQNKPKHKEDHSQKTYQREKIDRLLNIRERTDWTNNQKELIETILDKETKIVFISGPAGSSKSFTSIYSALKLLNDKKCSSIIYIRPVLESADSGAKIGFLPGDQSLKLQPYGQVLYDKLEELLPANDVKYLEGDDRIKITPVNYARGLNWVSECIIIDEAQGFVLGELKTILTRLSRWSKMIILADPSQSDLPVSKQGGFVKLFNLFSEEESDKMGIRCFELTEEDIVRSEICRFIVSKFREMDTTKNSNQPHSTKNRPFDIEDYSPSKNK